MDSWDHMLSPRQVRNYAISCVLPALLSTEGNELPSPELLQRRRPERTKVLKIPSKHLVSHTRLLNLLNEQIVFWAEATSGGQESADTSPCTLREDIGGN